MEPVKVALFIILGLCRRDIPYQEAEHYAQLFAHVPIEYGFDDNNRYIPLTISLHENGQMDPSVVSKTNDVGLLQIHARPASKAKIEALKHPETNIRVGCTLLQEYKRRNIVSWFQKYNPRSRGYGERVKRYYDGVLRKVQHYKRMQQLQGKV